MTSLLVEPLRQLRDLLTRLTVGSENEIGESNSSPQDDADEIIAQVELVLADFVELESDNEIAARAISRELEVIRERALALKLNRTTFRKCVLKLVRGHVASEYRLDASKRFSIVREVIFAVESSWLRFIENTILGDCDTATKQAFAAEWHDHSQFKKGIVGALIDAAFLASHAGETVGLTTIVAADMALELFRTLIAELRRHMTLNTRHVDALLDSLISRSFLPAIVHLWEHTGVVSASGSQMEGVLPARFRAEAVAEKQRIAAIKQRGVDARFEDTPPVHIVDIDDRVIEFNDCVRKIRDSLRVHTAPPPTEA